MNNHFYLLVSSLWILSANVFSQGMPDEYFNSLIRTENGGWVAGDATFSIFLPDGRTIWLFGDSFIGNVNSDSSLATGAHMIRNCAVIQDGEKMESRYNGTFENPENFVSTLTPDSTWFWPEHGIVENDTLKIIFSEFGTNDGPSGWNFEYLNAWIVFFTYPEIEYIQQKILPWYPRNGVMYGDRIMNFNGYNYIYGRKNESGSLKPHVARVNDNNILGIWEFFDGNEWSKYDTASQRISLFSVSDQYGVFEHQGKFVMITQARYLGSQIYSLISNTPEGLFATRKELYSTPYPFPDIFTYNAYSHPQFTENNELLISYNSNGDFWEIFNNVEIYRPKFIRVPFSAIDSSFTPTSITTETDINECLCYPNPAKNEIFFTTNTKTKLLKLEIFSITGEKMIALPLDVSFNEVLQIDISLLKPGIYIYRTGNTTGKFIHN